MRSGGRILIDRHDTMALTAVEYRLVSIPICMLLFLLVSSLVPDWGMVPTFQETNDDDYSEEYW